jgi:hypothetical protein
VIEIYIKSFCLRVGMNNRPSLEQKVGALEKLDKLQWIPLYGVYRSRTVLAGQSIVTHARNGHSALGDVWGMYHLFSAFACLGGLYYLGDRFLW